MESFQYHGQWWLPDDPDNHTYGTLKFQPEEGARLELIGSYEGLTNHGRPLTPRIILGRTKGGELVTLYGCYELEASFGGGGFATKTFRAYLVLIGALFEKEEDLAFPYLNLNYTYLEEWTELGGFENEYTDDMKNLAVRYRAPDPLTADLKDLRITITHRAGLSPGKFTEASMRHSVFIRIEPHHPLHFDEYQSTLCYHLQNFLSLGMGIATQPLQIDSNLEDEEHSAHIRIYYQQPELPDSGETYRWPNALFTFADIRDQFEIYLLNWFASAEQLKPVYDLYFALAYRPVVYSEHQFLSLIQAIEVYHRRWHIGQFMTNKEQKFYHSILKVAIPKDTAQGIKTHIYNALAHMQEYTLYERLLEIFKKTGDSAYGDILRLVIPDPNRFCQDVRNTRNFLTHYSPELAPKAKITGQELGRMIEEMKFVLEVFFLCVLDMPRETVKTLVLRTHKYEYLKRTRPLGVTTSPSIDT